MNPEIVLISKPREHCIWNSADAHLQAGAILDELGDDLANACFYRSWGRRHVLDQRPIAGAQQARTELRVLKLPPKRLPHHFVPNVVPVRSRWPLLA